jgi:RES domain-containing protein
MNLAACAALPTDPEVGTWYRAVEPRFLPAALSAIHTATYRGRYHPGGFQILYLAENHDVALAEVGAIFGSPAKPGGIVPNPSGSWVILNVKVSLQAVVDLTDPVATHAPLTTSVQELTGDWEGYADRGPHTKVRHPIGDAPTQSLGHALWKHGGYEGFKAVSSKRPCNEVLAVFPQRLKPGSFVTYSYTDSSGAEQTFSIVHSNATT